MKPNKKISQDFKERRLKANVTQTELSKETGIAQANISLIERGLKNPLVTTMEKLNQGLEKLS